MENLREKVNAVREKVLDELSQEIPTITDIVKREGYLLTTLSVIDARDEYFFVIFDFTSKQEEHMDDLAEYTQKLFDGFNKKGPIC